MSDHSPTPRLPSGRPGISGSVALVTGASGGIGTALVRRLLAEGATVVATSRKSSLAVEDGLTDAHRARLQMVQADMAELDGLAELVANVERQHGRLDLLLPNAGVADVRSLDDVSLPEWQHSLDVNLTAPFLLTQAAVVGMRERGFGRILYTSSAAAYVGGFVGPHYAAAKAGLHGLVHFVSSRTAPHGVTANAIAPALIDDTAMIAGLPADRPAPSVPVGRFGRPAEVADLAVAVLGNGYLTGQVLLLDGGLHPN